MRFDGLPYWKQTDLTNKFFGGEGAHDQSTGPKGSQI